MRSCQSGPLAFHFAMTSAGKQREMSSTKVSLEGCPAFICFTESSKSCWNCSFSDGILNFLSQLCQKTDWQSIQM